MNRTLRLVGMAAMVLLLAASCKKEKQNEDRLVMKTFSAGIAQNGNAKTGLIPEGDASTDNGHYFKQVWLDDDKILVNNKEFLIDPATIVATETGCTASFTGLVEPSKDYYYAIYPVNSDATYDPTSHTATFKIPNKQVVEKRLIGDDHTMTMYVPEFLPMAAKCSADADELAFTNLCGLLEVRLYSTANLDLTVSSIELATNSSGEYLSGTWEYDFNSMNFSPKANLNNRISMSFKEESIKVSNDKNNPTSFLFVIPPVDASKNFSLYITGNSVQGTYVTVPRVAGESSLSITASNVLYNKTPILLEPTLTIVQNSAYISTSPSIPEGISIDNNQIYCIGTFSNINFGDGIEIVEAGFNYVDRTTYSNKTDYPFPNTDWTVTTIPDYVQSQVMLPETLIGTNNASIKGYIKGEVGRQYDISPYVIWKYTGEGQEATYLLQNGSSQTYTLVQN